MAMFDRIEMNVVYVALEIILIAQGMLPIAALPNASFSSAEAAPRDFFIVRKSTGELCLYEAPACSEIRIAVRQGPDGVQMVRQDHSPSTVNGCRFCA
jgi:hypothetical protein